MRSHLSAFFVLIVGLFVAACSARAQERERQPQPAKAEQLFALANETRAQAGLGRLEWDQALADAAMKHCMRMAVEGPISHRYGGEPDLAARAGDAGARFGLIEENIAVGSYAARIHQGWMESPGHRANLLNPEIDRIGVAVVSAQGVLFAVADYTHGVPQLTPAQVESKVGELIRVSGVIVRRDTTDARMACGLDSGLPRLTGGGQPQFVMRWQNADITRLPNNLAEKLASGRYRQAEIGSCPAHNVEAAFTVYRVAVLLY